MRMIIYCQCLVFELQAILDAQQNYADDHNVTLNGSIKICMRFSFGIDSFLPDLKIKLDLI